MPWKTEAQSGLVGTGVSIGVGGKNYVLTAANPTTFAVKILGPDKAEFSLFSPVFRAAVGPA